MWVRTSNDKLVEKAWGNDAEYIDSWRMEGNNISDLRFIIRDGQKILQAKYRVHVYFSKPLFRFDFGNGGNVDTEEKRMWLDVPLEEE
jgi:hypothetical protein